MGVEAERVKDKIRAATTIDDVFVAIGSGTVSPEAYAAEIVWDALRPVVVDLRDENRALIVAFHDATRRPLGVTPASGDRFYDPHLAMRAEESRPLIGSDKELAERPERQRDAALTQLASLKAAVARLERQARARPDRSTAKIDP